MSTSHAQSSPIADEHATPAQIVDALKTVAGNPPQARASFAKGQCVRGTYTPTSAAASITRSVSFTKSHPLRGRFSMGGGNPHVPDTNRLVLRGLALAIGEGSEETDLLVENAPVHFARTLDQMLGFLRARAPGADGKPDAAKVKAFSDANPETLNQAHFVAAHPLPGSFAGTTYWGVHAFPATDAKGETRMIKFKVVPQAGEISLSDDAAKDRAADFLFQDLRDRIEHGEVRFDVFAILGSPDDPTQDVTVRWPDEDTRETVKLGTIAIQAIDNNEACDATFFNPGAIADGIGRPDDEIFAARSAAYAISLGKRR
jgi:catalase